MNASSWWQRCVSRRLAILLAVCGALAAANTATAQVTWKDKTYPVDALPGPMSAQAKEAVENWAAWAREHDYRLDVDPTARILLVSPQASTPPQRPLELIAATAKLYDALLPPPKKATANPDSRAEPASSTPEAGGSTAPIPEDPESAPPVLVPPKKQPKSAPGKSAPKSSWGSAEFEPDSQAAVMLILRNQGEYAQALDLLGKQQSYLKDWREDARSQSGFAIESPLCGAYIASLDGQEEWNPDNELVHRVMQLLVLRRFGTMPFWLQTGLSWHAEFSVLNTVYCFPYRSEFVGVGEHGGWDKELHNRFESRIGKPVEITEFAEWKRGSYQDGPAKLAWGMVDFIAKVEPKQFSALLEEFRVTRDQDNRTKKPDGTWERKRNYEIPTDRQREILQKNVGEDLFENATAYWAKGTLPKAKGTKSIRTNKTQK